jgi:uncharacterized damage-inducible protein DinB
MSIAALLLPEFDHEMANTRKMLERLPETLPQFQPHAKSMTLARLASHVAEMPVWGDMTLRQDVLSLTADMKPASAATRAELLENFDKNRASCREALEGETDEHLMATWKLVFEGKTHVEMPRLQVFRNMVMNHMIHHRAQLGVYLRLQDIAFPGMYGPSADDPKWWEAASK